MHHGNADHAKPCSKGRLYAIGGILDGITGGRIETEVLNRTSSGGVCVNETLMHLVPHDLPFGGVGPSGMGAYHGRTGFETFSHRKSVLNKSTLVDPQIAYPPFTSGKTKWVKRLL